MPDNYTFREHEPDRDERPRCRECDDAGCPACDRPTMRRIYSTIGSVKGQLEFINVHGAENVFRVYPLIGPKFVECRFPERLKSEATAAVGRNVRVSGKLHQRAGEQYPSSVEVRRIEVLPLDSELPSLLDIRGMAPDVTGSLSSEDFVRSLRLAREKAMTEALDNPDCPLHSPNSDHAEAPAQDNRLRVRCPVCRYSALISPLDAPHVDCGTCGIPMVADARTPEDS